MGYVVIRRRGQLILLSSAPTVGHVIGSPPRRPTHQENQVARPGKAKTPRAFLGRAGVTPVAIANPVGLLRFRPRPVPAASVPQASYCGKGCASTPSAGSKRVG